MPRGRAGQNNDLHHATLIQLGLVIRFLTEPLGSVANHRYDEGNPSIPCRRQTDVL